MRPGIVYVTTRGRRVAVLVDELVTARTEDEYVPWEEVKADFGLL